VSLYTTGFLIRRFFVIFWIFIGLLVSIGLIGKITDSLIKPNTIVTPEVASQGFGVISPPKMVPDPLASVFKPKSFSVDTANGNIPNLFEYFKKDPTNDKEPALVNIYKIVIPQILSEARNIGPDLASYLQFSQAPEKTNNELTFAWSDGKRRLTYSVETRNYEMLTSNIASIDIASEQKGSPESAGSFFSSLFTTIKTKVDYPLSYYKNEYVKYNYDKGTWDISTDGKPTNFIRSSLIRYSRTRGKEALPLTLAGDSALTDKKVVKEVYPNYDYSTMYIILKNTSSPKPSDVIEMKFNRFDYDITNPNTYNIKTSDEAYQEIQQGKVSPITIRAAQTLAPLSESVVSKVSAISIKSVDVGYFLSNVKPQFALPVYIFKCSFVINVEGTQQTLGEAIYYVYAFK